VAVRRFSAGLVLAAVTLAMAASSPPAPTFNGKVDAILRRRCDECHHPGDVGPKSYTDYATASAEIASMLGEIDAGRMPPWKPTRGIEKFVGERVITPAEVDTLRRWRDAGMPEGSASAKLKPVVYPDGWTLGTPDAILDYGQAFTVPAGGDDIYRCFPVRNPFGRDVWLSAMDVHPGDRRVVHHVVLYVDSAGESFAKDDADPGPGYTCFGGPATSQPTVLGGWAPGNRARPFPRGTAIRLAANDTVVVQCHYHNHDAATDIADETTVGLYLSPDPNPQPIYLLPVLNDTFTIPAGNAAYAVEAVFDPAQFGGGLFKVQGHVLAVMPHMHLLGRQIAVDILLPDGTEQRLVEILDWDFNWQGTYTLQRAAAVPVGAKFRVRSVYDNSSGNPRNPNVPPIDVSWGERTVDEMCLAFLAVTLGPAKADAPPVVTSVREDAKGRLVVTARNLGRGGRIEIEGVPVADSVSVAANHLVSASDWDPLVVDYDPFAGPPHPPTMVRVRRADGRLSPPFPFQRLF
jgi:hypothetical protein